jgi:hypothetical protein
VQNLFEKVLFRSLPSCAVTGARLCQYRLWSAVQSVIVASAVRATAVQSQLLTDAVPSPSKRRKIASIAAVRPY